jgi:hypothetical protein
VVPRYRFVDLTQRFNHACRPSADYHFDHRTLTLHVFATRPILPGEEIKISYIDPVQRRRQRVRNLQSNWGFACDCDSCSASSEAVMESDARIQRILDLWDEFEDESDLSLATPALAEVYIGLVEKEGLWIKLHEAHAIAAREYVGVGDGRNAMRYARKALGYGEVCRASWMERADGKGYPGDGDSYREMKLIANRPEHHPMWRSRLGLNDGWDEDVDEREEEEDC